MIYAEFTALVSVIVIDLVLAGDNAVVVGMAAAGLRRGVVLRGICPPFQLSVGWGSRAAAVRAGEAAASRLGASSP